MSALDENERAVIDAILEEIRVANQRLRITADAMDKTVAHVAKAVTVIEAAAKHVTTVSEREAKATVKALEARIADLKESSETITTLAKLAVRATD